MRIHTAAVPPFMKNGFVVWCENSRRGVLIDPGDEVDELLEVARASALVIEAILLTHAHFDHITGVGRAQAALGAPIWLHRDDQFLYDGVVEQGRMFGLDVAPQPPIDRFYDTAQVLVFGDCSVEWRHTPGHCPGGVCLSIGQDRARAHGRTAAQDLFVGDTLFAGSIGRTDLPGGSPSVLLTSIRNVLFQFPDATVVHPGHGPATTIRRERTSNPFLINSPAR